MPSDQSEELGHQGRTEANTLFRLSFDMTDHVVCERTKSKMERHWRHPETLNLRTFLKVAWAKHITNMSVIKYYYILFLQHCLNHNHCSSQKLYRGLFRCNRWLSRKKPHYSTSQTISVACPLSSDFSLLGKDRLPSTLKLYVQMSLLKWKRAQKCL